MKTNDRLQALKILIELMEHQASLSQLMPSSAQITPLTKELCFGFCRHYFRLEAIALKLLDKKPKDLDVWTVLLLGLYQLQYMNKPEYATVKETVALLEKIGKNWAKGLVNAVLRNFCRRSEELLSQLKEGPVFNFGQPEWLLKRIKMDWPLDWEQIAAANDAHPPMTLRINSKKTTRDEYLDVLNKAGLKARSIEGVPQAIILEEACDVYQLPGFEQGQVSVQDAAAQCAVALLDLKPGLRVLDACSAPGGKTCHILEIEPELEACIALDLDAKRLNRVKENLQRLELQATVMQGDASQPQTWWDGLLFDRILLDAPCSATGVIRRHPDIKLLRRSEEVQAIVQRQKVLLEALWPLLKAGGLLVYATCSIIADENEKQIAAFLKEHPKASVLENKGLCGRTTGHGLQILPGEQEMDGFFYSVLRNCK